MVERKVTGFLIGASLSEPHIDELRVPVWSPHRSAFLFSSNVTAEYSEKREYTFCLGGKEGVREGEREREREKENQIKRQPKEILKLKNREKQDC